MNISPNTSALMALNELRKNSNRIQKIMNKAALGEKIASAGDDASNYAISEKMRANIRALNQDIVNASTGNRLIATAESGIHEIVNNLRAIKELAINAANDSNTDADRAIMQKNVDQRLEEIDDIAATTNYNGKYLLDGTYRKQVIKGAGEADLSAGTSSEKLSGFLDGFTVIGSGGRRPGGAYMAYIDKKCPLAYSGDTTKLKVDFSKSVPKDGSELKYPESFDGEAFSMGCEACHTYIDIIFDASKTAAESTVTYADSGEKAAYDGELGSGIRTVYSYTYTVGIKDVTDEASLEKAMYDGVYAANDKVDNEYAVNKPEGAYLGIPWSWTHDVRVTYDGTSCYLEGSPRPDWPFYAGSIGGGGLPDEEPLGPYETIGQPLVIHTGPKSAQQLNVYIEDMSTKAMGIDKLDITTRARAEATLSRKGSEVLDGVIDKAIEYALGECTQLGAYYQELEFTQDNLTTESEAVTNAESVIRDADMALTMMEYSRFNVLSQASQAMLGQANQNVGSKLDLLQ